MKPWKLECSWLDDDDDNPGGGWERDRDDDYRDHSHYNNARHGDHSGGDRNHKNGHDARQRDDSDGQQRGDDYGRQRGDDDSWQRDDGMSGRDQTQNSTCPSQQQPEAPPSGGSDGMAAILGGNALAIGESTFATGTVQGILVDYGSYSIYEGSAEFVSTAAGEVALTDANTSADVIGADFVFIFSFDTDVAADGISTSTSNMQVLAIDLANWSPPSGQIVVEQAVDVGIALPGPGEVYGFEEPSGGNLATVSAASDAIGSETLADTSTYALTVANALSLVEATALTAIG